MNEPQIFRTYKARLSKAEKHLREEFANDVIREFGPIIASFGFARSGWSFDKDLDIIQVYFADAQREHAVQIDCDMQRGSFTPNYCRKDGEWEICREGKPKSFIALKKTLTRWLQNHCEECCIECQRPGEIWEQDEYSLVPCPRCDDKGRVERLSA